MIKGWIYTMIGILLLTIIIIIGTYYYKSLEINNFQVTIQDLNDEQKCLHICGFEWHGYFESYKFCMEKCDRISERLNQKLKNG